MSRLSFPVAPDGLVVPVVIGLTWQEPGTASAHCLPSRLNSAGRSPARLVSRTVHETFVLIRLLAGAILVTDTSRRCLAGRLGRSAAGACGRAAGLSATERPAIPALPLPVCS